MVGTTIGHYRIEEKLGAGGMGEVFRALDTRLNRPVAVKRLAPTLASQPQYRRRFEQEAVAAARLNHPGIATVHQLEKAGDNLYIVYEYVPGETLRKVIQRGGTSYQDAVAMAAAIARSLAVAHTMGVVHRDLKPENIMRTPQGQCKILDFGLASLQIDPSGGDTRSVLLSEPGAIGGTLSYMSPEQLESRPTDSRTDIFSFGVLLFEMISGIRPFSGSSAAATIAAILTAEPEPLPLGGHPAMPELERIVRKCLRKDPAARYQSTEDLAVDLEHLSRETERAAGTAPAPNASTAPAGAARESDDSYLQRMFRALAPSMRRWWEFHTLFSLFFVCPMSAYLGWAAREAIPEPWRLTLFALLVLTLSIAAGLRLYLLNTAVWNPPLLGQEVRRMAVWVRTTAWGFSGTLIAMGGWAMNARAGLGAIVLSFGVMGAVVVLAVEPALERGAFPEG